MHAEQAFELARRQARAQGERRPRYWVLNAALHFAEYPQETRMGHPETFAQTHALRPAAPAHLRVQEPVAYGRGEPVPVIGLDQRVHEIKCRDTPGAGEPIAVDLEQRVRDRKAG